MKIIYLIYDTEKENYLTIHDEFKELGEETLFLEDLSQAYKIAEEKTNLFEATLLYVREAYIGLGEIHEN